MIVLYRLVLAHVPHCAVIATQDELDEAARIGRKEQDYVADRAHAHADHLVHKVKH